LAACDASGQRFAVPVNTTSSFISLTPRPPGLHI
jgi:hypothetical protein